MKEIKYCEAATHKYEHYAARFAAKEAFFKAIGTGWTNGTAFNEIETSEEYIQSIYNSLIGKQHVYKIASHYLNRKEFLL